MKQLFGGLIVLLLALAFTTRTFAQEQSATQKEEKKEQKTEMAKSEKEMGPLKTASCDDKCGFMVRSRSEKELVSIVKSHAKKVHKMDMTDKQIKEMIKTEPEPATKN
jgi:predicted small metal-binding protein